MSKVQTVRRKFAAAGDRLDWPKALAEFIIVVLGVFIGMQVTNWNEQRQEREGTLRLLDQFRPELASLAEDGERMRAYYKVNDSYVERAFAGWNGDTGIGDEEFVTSAFQASRVEGQALNTEVWAQIYGADQIRNVRDPALRNALIDVLTIDSSIGDWRQLMTDYRTKLRRIVPEDIQSVIQRDCSEDPVEESRRTTTVSTLNPTCDTRLSDDDFAEAARILRNHPELVGDLRQHQSVVAVYLYNNDLAQQAFAQLAEEIARVRDE